MFANKQKFLLVFFVTTTTILAILSCYSVYMYVGVASATRSLGVTLLNYQVDNISDTEVTLKTNLQISNPSEFSFKVNRSMHTKFSPSILSILLPY